MRRSTFSQTLRLAFPAHLVVAWTPEEPINVCARNALRPWPQTSGPRPSPKIDPARCLRPLHSFHFFPYFPNRNKCASTASETINEYSFFKNRANRHSKNQPMQTHNGMVQHKQAFLESFNKFQLNDQTNHLLVLPSPFCSTCSEEKNKPRSPTAPVTQKRSFWIQL